MSVQVSHLANGLCVATDYMPQVETASLGLWVGVGTRDEPAEQNGIAHLLEHMAFKGTTTRSARAIAEMIEDVGGHLNAYTTREQTAYYAKILAEDSALAADLLSDILRRSVFDAEELKRERAVVLQEIGQSQDTPDDIIFDHFQATAFPDQPLGRPVLGLAPVVESLERDHLVAYLDSHYGAGNMVAVAAGRIDHDAFVKMIEAGFGDLPTGRQPDGGIARYQGGDYSEARELEQVHLVLGFPAIAADDPDYYALSAYSTILGGGMSSRLFQEVRENRGLVYSVYSFASCYRDGGVLGIYAGTGEEEVAELVPVVCEQLRALTGALEEPELNRAKAQLRAGMLMGRESTSSRAEALAQQIQIHNRPLSVAEILEKLDAVTTADIRRIAEKIVSGTPTIACLGPEASPARADVLAKLPRYLA